MLKRLVYYPNGKRNCGAPVFWPGLKGRHVPRAVGHEECSAPQECLLCPSSQLNSLWFGLQGYSFKCSPLWNSVSTEAASLWSGEWDREPRWGGSAEEIIGKEDLTETNSFPVFPPASPGLCFYIHFRNWANENQGKAGQKDFGTFCSSSLSSLSSCLLSLVSTNRFSPWWPGALHVMGAWAHHPRGRSRTWGSLRPGSQRLLRGSEPARNWPAS